MRAPRLVTGAVLLVLALGACGQSGDQGSPAAGQSTPTTSAPSSAPSTPSSLPVPSPTKAPPASGVPQGAVPVPEGQVDTSGLPDYYRERKVWVSNDGRTLQVTAMARDACAGVTGRVEEQNDSLVRIVISPMDVPQGGSPDGPPICAQVLTPKIISVELKAPLGNRKVIVTDAAS